MEKNPFHHGKPVRHPRDFFGRKEEVRNIYRQILASNSVSLIGERRIGKTSLLLHLVHPQTITKYGILPENSRIFYLDISTCSFFKSSDLFQRLLRFINNKIDFKIKEKINILLKKEYIKFQEFEKIISDINDNNLKIIFLFDEFEKIAGIRKGNIFSQLRYIAQMYDVVFVISTSRDLMSLYQEERFLTSPFFNIFTKYQLHGLDVNACRELITVNFERAGFKIDPSVSDSIIRFSGTNPFFLKLTCYFYFENVLDGSYAFDSEIKDYIQQELESHHAYNWEHLQRNEQIALLDIVKNGNTGDGSAKSSLERKGYIAIKGTDLYIISESFGRFIKSILDYRSQALNTLGNQIFEIDTQKNITEDDKITLKKAMSNIEKEKLNSLGLRPPMYGIIGYLELELRKFCKNVLISSLGPEWFKNTLDKKSREEIEKRINNAKKREVDFEFPENPFDFAILENLRDVILRRNNWEIHFYKYFEDKNVFEVKMQEIIDLRNRIAHYRLINFNEAVTVVLNVLWMLTHMRKKS